MLLHLSHMLGDIGVVFDEEKNYIRCFTHIINLCSQAVIKVMEKDDADAAYSDSETEPATESSDSDGLPATMRATRVTRKAGPICRARKTVAFIQKSGQHRDELQNIISEGNTDSRWMASSTETETVLLGSVTLLLDVKTRWDSVFYMLRRLRYLQQVS